MSTYRDPLTDYSPQMEFSDVLGELPPEPRGVVLTEAEETELAAEFLGVNSDDQMDHFLGKFIHTIGKNVKKWVKGPQGQALVGVLKNVAKEALPLAGGAVGTVVGGPAGAMIGSNLASMAGSVLGLELEGLSPEDRDLEASRQFIRFASQTVANALDADPREDPWRAAHTAAKDAARVYAPGLMDIGGTRRHPYRRGSGKWFRQGDTIVVIDVFNHKGDGKMTHDIDRTQVGFGQGEGGYGPPPYGGSVLNEEENANLAAGLMEVNSEDELDNFLGDIISGVANTVGKFINSPTGKALGNGLKDVAKQLLPAAGTALGTYIGGPVGGQIGGTLGSAVGGALEVAPEDAEWEAANQFVKLAADATKNAAEMPQGDPHATAHHAIVEAAKVHAPHIVPYLTGGHQGHWQHGHGCGCQQHHGRRHHGHWYRQGNSIVLVEV